MAIRKKPTKDKADRDRLWNEIKNPVLIYINNNGLTFKQVAIKVNVSPTNFCKYFNESASPSWETIERLKEVLES